MKEKKFERLLNRELKKRYKEHKAGYDLHGVEGFEQGVGIAKRLIADRKGILNESDIIAGYQFAIRTLYKE